MAMSLDLTRSVAPNLLMLRILGHWPFGLPNLYTKVYTNFVNFAMFSYNFGQLIYLLQNMSNFQLVADTIYNFSSTVSALTKLKLVYRDRDLFKNILDTLEIPEFQPTNEKQRQILKKSVGYANFIFYSFCTMATFTLFMWIFFPILDKEKRLPSNSWFPFDWTGKYYAATYSWQTVCITYHAYSNVTLDTFFSIAMIQLGAQCEVLNDRILKFADVEDFGDEKKVRQRFTVCLKHHQLILEWSRKMADLFRMPVLIQFATSVAVLCETMFMLSTTNIFSATYVMLLFFQTAIFTEIFLYCWFGNEVIVKSETLLYSAFSSQWFNCSQKIKKDILFFVHRTQKPIVLFVGNIFPVSVLTFTSILRSSWAYFMALRNIKM